MSKESLQKLGQLLPKEFDYTIASAGGYIFSIIEIPTRFEVFISETKLGIKHPKANLPNEKIDAISTLLKLSNIMGFEHSTYGDKSVWSIWNLNVEGLTHQEISKLVGKLKNLSF